ncbi:MAG: IS91 family transposase [bacterium]
MGHHPHIHALVPGGGPSLDGQRWITSRHPTQSRRRKPFLVDNVELRRSFRKHYVDGLRRLIRKSELRLEGEWFWLQDPPQREVWFDELTATDWNVFIEGPPNGKSRPTDVLKYLARYMTGGPISDRRLISDEDGTVTFWARSKDKGKKKRSERFSLKGTEFVRRWTMHILPKGYTRSRAYGGYHGRKRTDYLDRCRQLLKIAADAPLSSDSRLDDAKPTGPMCPHCEVAMHCIGQQSRPSWKKIFERHIYADPAIYSPMHYIQSRTPNAHPIDEYG